MAKAKVDIKVRIDPDRKLYLVNKYRRNFAEFIREAIEEKMLRDDPEFKPTGSETDQTSNV